MAVSKHSALKPVMPLPHSHDLCPVHSALFRLWMLGFRIRCLLWDLRRLRRGHLGSRIGGSVPLGVCYIVERMSM
jgi:hypothetical protein